MTEAGMTGGSSGAVADWLRRQYAVRPEEFRVEVEGASLACHGWNLAATHLPGLVLVHGFRAHVHWWDHIAPSLAGSHRVVAFSSSGMGDSDRRENYSRAQFGREITGVARACGFVPAVVVAHSFGSIGALLAASAEPEAISRLIVIDAGLRARDEIPHDIVVRPRRVYPSLEASLERFRLIPPGDSPEPLVRDYIARNAVRKDPDGWTWKFDPLLPASLNREDVRGDFPQVKVPVDAILGEHTEIMTPPRVAELHRMAPSCGEAIVVPASDHHVMIDQPVALVSALRALLANPRGQSR